MSVWDGDWAILEEYDSTGSVVQKYVQGYHGLVKTLVDNIYYYQDELGSTSHIASSAGALLEYYKYDLNGKPTYWSPSNSQLPSSNYGTKDLFTGQRLVPELGLYDDRNRFMSPDLGRFLQPDPIGFKGDGSNLYRYCGNDWANKTDPMGLAVFGDPQAQYAQMENDQRDQNMGMEHSLPLAQVLSYHVYQVWGVSHGTLAQMQQTMNASSVSVTGQATPSHGTQGRQSSSTGTPTSFQILEGQTVPHGKWSSYEYQALVNGKPTFTSNYEVREQMAKVYMSKSMGKFDDGGAQWKALDHGKWSDRVGLSAGVPKMGLDIHDQRFFVRTIGDPGNGTPMQSHFQHITNVMRYHVENVVFDIGLRDHEY